MVPTPRDAVPDQGELPREAARPTSGTPERPPGSGRTGIAGVGRKQSPWRRDLGVAVCDTDPLKLHFIWAMRQIGEVAESHWTAQLKFTRQALYDRRLGFADRYLFKQISPDVAQAQRDHDASRSRPNFDLHLRLSSSLVRLVRNVGGHHARACPLGATGGSSHHRRQNKPFPDTTLQCSTGSLTCSPVQGASLWFVL